MEVLGVDMKCQHDLEVALTEACTNVLTHSGPGDDYEVVVGIDDDACVIEVVDKGHGFDSENLGFSDANPSAERGRGIQLMRALVDKVTFTSKPERGTIVHLEKELTWYDGSPAQRLAARVAGAPAERSG